MKNPVKQTLILALFATFALLAMRAYYSGGLHLESAKSLEGSFTYFIILLLSFGGYEAAMRVTGKKERTIGAFGIIGGLLWTILVVSFATYSKAGASTSGGFVLFFQVIKYAMLPLTIAFISAAFWTFLLKKLSVADTISSDLKIPLSLGLGFSAFISLNAILWFFGVFQIWSALWILAVLTAIARKEIWEMLKGMASYRFEAPGIVPAGISAFFLLVLFTIVSVNLTNVVRPFPIGWDDLGVYMNFARIMAQVENTREMGMVLWQTFTAIGHMTNSAPQAFFLNEMGSLLSIIAVFFGTRSLLPKKPHYLSLPLLASTVFMVMPMVIFQQAKDMKLDSGLFGISVIALVTLLAAFREKDDSRTRNVLYALSGFLMGIAFAIKFTSLMAILGAIAALCYLQLGFGGFAGFTSVFVSSFTALHLWDFLNVNYPKDNPKGLMIFSAIVGIAGLAAFAYGIYRNRGGALVKNLLVPFGLFVAGVLVPLAPWLVKDLAEASFHDFSINTLLNGKVASFNADYHKIYSDAELKKIQDKIDQNAINAEGKSENEDLGRYFGYEEGINNYLKLPLNLTLQSNQPGEFTDITYVYLALVPGAILLFEFPSTLGLVAYTAFALTMFGYFFVPGIGTSLTAFFGHQLLPLGYAYIVGIGLLPFAILHLSSRKDNNRRLFLSLFAFTTLYVLLFIVAAFGIVWYGILMYFAFLAISALCLEPHIRTETDPENKPFNLATTALLLFIVMPYFLFSALTHAWVNVPGDGLQFKSGQMSQDEAIFIGHPEYLPLIAKFNLNDETKLTNQVLASIKNDQLKKYFEGIKDVPVAPLANEFLRIEQSAANQTDGSLASAGLEARELRHDLYHGILVPEKDNRNEAPIYRIGTFLTYYISENKKRFFDDSLLFELDRYFFGSDDREKAIDRMKKMGMKYLLVDLNAATIDRDPRHELTRRYERVLDLMKSDRLSLVSTDSPCLQVALANKDVPTYMQLAGVNYRSYAKAQDGREGVITAEQKLDYCQSVIAKIIWEKQVSDTSYPFLKGLSSEVLARNPKDADEVKSLIQGAIGRGWMSSFEIR